MSFKKVEDLRCDLTISLGGRDKKSGKENPTRVEGYFLGSREIPDRFSKTGKGLLHVFRTPKGKLGVFGKTDLNRKLSGVTPGTMTRASFSEMVPTKNGNDMYRYEIEIDQDNCIEVNVNANNSDSYQDADSTEDGDYEDLDAETELDEPTPPRPVRAAKAVSAPDAAQRAKAQALLSGKKF